jgi:hypothetical protein
VFKRLQLGWMTLAAVGGRTESPRQGGGRHRQMGGQFVRVWKWFEAGGGWDVVDGSRYGRKMFFSIFLFTIGFLGFVNWHECMDLATNHKQKPNSLPKHVIIPG